MHSSEPLSLALTFLSEGLSGNLTTDASVSTRSFCVPSEGGKRVRCVGLETRGALKPHWGQTGGFPSMVLTEGEGAEEE